MSVTAGFKARHRSSVRGTLVTLVSVSPRDPVTLVPTQVYLSSAVVHTPADSVTGDPARIWVPLLLDTSPISAPGAFADTDLGLCTCTLKVARTALGPSTQLIDGAAVSVWLWNTADTDFSEAALVLKNASVLTFDDDADAITLHVRQRTNWNRDLVPIEVAPEDFPHAPDDSIGQAVPIVYGAMRDVALRTPWQEYQSTADVVTPAPSGTPSRGSSVVLGGRRVGAAVLVDTGRGTGATTTPKAKVLVASHKCKTVSDATKGLGVYMRQQDKFGYVEPVDAVNDVFNTTTGAGILIPDDASIAWLSQFPSDLEYVTNTAENPRALLDGFNENNYAKFDWTAGLKTIRLKLPSPNPSLGECTEIYIFCGYRSVANTNFKTLLRPNGSLTGGIGVNLDPTSTRRILMVKYAVTPWAAPFDPNNPWSLDGLTLEVGWPTYSVPVVGTGTGEIYFVGLAFKFKPRQDMLQSAREFVHNETRPITVRKGRDETVVWQPYTVREVIPATTEINGKFFANVEGYADDGEFASAGSFTGTASALIERAPDVLAHMLVAYGKEPLASIERGVGVFGSFIDARALLQSPRKADMLYALSVAKTSDVMDAIAWLSQASVSFVMLDRFTDTWRMLPWRTDKAVDYDWTFRPQDIVEGATMKVARTPSNRVLTGIALGYGNDEGSKKYKHKTRLAWDGSTAGHKYRGLRDEHLTVVAGVNDRLDFTTTASFVAFLTVGAYAPGAFGQMVTTAMKTINTGLEFAVTHGPTVLSTWNDQMSFRDLTNAVDRVITIPASAYANFEALCASVASLASAICGFTVGCQYDRATRKVGFNVVGGQIRLYHTGTNWISRRFYATLGHLQATDRDILTSTYIYGAGEREEEKFAVACINNAISLNFETGANGLLAARRNASSLLGFDTLRDLVSGGTVRSWLGDTPKNNREAALAKTAARFGARRDTVEDLRVVLDTDTAREVRNRIANLLGTQRLVATFSTEKAPDMERGRVIQFSGDFDAVRRYPDPDSDGSWVGKRFVVVEVEQMLGPVAYYTKLRAVSLA